MLLSISICVDDLNKEKLITSKNGKKYADLSIATLNEPNQFGKDVQVYEYDKQTKKKHFVGSGKIFGKTQEQPQQKPDVADDSEMPF